MQEVLSPDRRSAANKSNAALQQFQHQWRTTGVLEITRRVQGITFEVIRTFLQKGARAKKLLVKAADAASRSRRTVANGRRKGQRGVEDAQITASHPACELGVRQEGGAERLDDAGGREAVPLGWWPS